MFKYNNKEIQLLTFAATVMCQLDINLLISFELISVFKRDTNYSIATFVCI